MRSSPSSTVRCSISLKSRCALCVVKTASSSEKALPRSGLAPHSPTRWCAAGEPCAAEGIRRGGASGLGSSSGSSAESKSNVVSPHRVARAAMKWGAPTSLLPGGQQAIPGMTNAQFVGHRVGRVSGILSQLGVQARSLCQVHQAPERRDSVSRRPSKKRVALAGGPRRNVSPPEGRVDSLLARLP
jgi:hypothetical protein